MKVCSVCNEIVSLSKGCNRTDCIVRSDAAADPIATTAPKPRKVIPGPTGRSDRAVQAGLDRAGDVARNATRRAAFAITVIFAVVAAIAAIGFNLAGDNRNKNADASAAVDASPQAMVSQEVWECDYDSPPFTVTLSENSYKFAPYNPDGGQLEGTVRVLDEWDRGLKVTNLELVGSGAPEGRWAFVQDDYGGKRRALMAYAVESSGDGSECILPGQAPQYEFN